MERTKKQYLMYGQHIIYGKVKSNTELQSRKEEAKYKVF